MCITDNEIYMKIDRLKNNIKEYYDKESEFRNSKQDKPEWKIREREKFLNLLKQEKKETLLELGAGAGYDSLFFMNNGLKVTAIDISASMVKNCREKSIEAYETDFYQLSSLGRKFDSVWALNTLLHVPKPDLPHVLKEINQVLKINGLFYMGLYGGDDTEKEIVKAEISDVPRYFVFHSGKFLEAQLKDFFNIINFETVKINRENDNEEFIFHSITMEKKPL